MAPGNEAAAGSVGAPPPSTSVEELPTAEERYEAEQELGRQAARDAADEVVESARRAIAKAEQQLEYAKDALKQAQAERKELP
jgi:hypothetical protein